jgi:type I restriction enzyme S subunit
MTNGWTTSTLEDVCKIERGGSPRPIKDFITTDPNGINWIKISDATASGKYIYSTEEKIRPEGAKRSRLVREGDFILSNSMSFGRPYIMRTKGAIHDGWLVLRPREMTLDQDYLYYLLGSDMVYQQFDRLAAGSTVRNLNIGLVKTVKISFPPLAEQRRIVGILHEAFEAIATASANAEKNLQNAGAIYESQLRNIFIERAAEWPQKTLRDLCLFENGDRGSNYPSKSARTATGIPFINAGHLTEHGLDLAEMDYISRDRFDLLSNGKIRPGDILFCLRGSLGKFASVGDLQEGAIASSLVIVRPSSGLLRGFLIAYFRSPICQKMIEDFKNGAAQPNLSAESLRQFVIPVPPISTQIAVVEELEELRAATQRLTSIYQHKVDAFEAMKKALLHQAFSGNL